jgi:hypothetical protein
LNLNIDCINAQQLSIVDFDNPDLNLNLNVITHHREKEKVVFINKCILNQLTMNHNIDLVSFSPITGGYCIIPDIIIPNGDFAFRKPTVENINRFFDNLKILVSQDISFDKKPYIISKIEDHKSKILTPESSELPNNIRVILENNNRDNNFSHVHNVEANKENLLEYKRLTSDSDGEFVNNNYEDNNDKKFEVIKPIPQYRSRYDIRGLFDNNFSEQHNMLTLHEQQQKFLHNNIKDDNDNTSRKEKPFSITEALYDDNSNKNNLLSKQRQRPINNESNNKYQPSNDINKKDLARGLYDILSQREKVKIVLNNNCLNYRTTEENQLNEFNTLCNTARNNIYMELLIGSEKENPNTNDVNSMRNNCNNSLESVIPDNSLSK